MAQVTRTLLRVLLGALLLCAGALKAADTQQFTLSIHNFHLTSWSVSVLLAVYLPWLEVITGAALLLRRLYAGALASTLLLSTLFFAAVASAWSRAIDISCGCFGASQNQTHYPSHIAGNLALLAAAAALSILEWRAWREKSPSSTNECGDNPPR